ncbi:predicted protein, partial [Nematostella vectensis]
IVVRQGEDIDIGAQITAKPKPNVKWYKDGKPLRDGPRTTIRARDDLYNCKVLSAKPEDTGMYKCEATNAVGKATRTFDVQVEGTY